MEVGTVSKISDDVKVIRVIQDLGIPHLSIQLDLRTCFCGSLLRQNIKSFLESRFREDQSNSSAERDNLIVLFISHVAIFNVNFTGMNWGSARDW